jgi:CubicO group peptidase (beta-lactamase class C family)
VIRGDTGVIIGRSKGFVYNGRDANDPDSPFLTLLPGDRYNLNTRRVISRAAERSNVSAELVRAMFAKYDDPALGGATVLVARDGEVLVNAAFGIGPQERHLPRTTVPQFELGDMARVFTALCDQLPPPGARGRGGAAGGGGGGGGRGRGGPPPSPLQSCVSRVASPVGAQRTSALDSTRVQSNVDELYRIALGLEVPTTWRNVDYGAGWATDQYRGVTRHAAYATADGKRAAFVRVPERRVTVIILTNDAGADARGMAEQLLDRTVLGGA